MLIRKFPTIFSVLISLLVCLGACAPKSTSGLVSGDEPSTRIAVFAATGSNTIRLRTAILFGKAQLTGITVVKTSGDTARGVFLNEFGIKGFEFEVVRGKCRLLHILKNMDKWYIRRTISDDLAYIFTISDAYRTADGEYVASFGKQTYIYSLRDGKTVKSARKSGGKITGTMDLSADSIYRYENVRRNLAYTFQFIHN